MNSFTSSSTTTIIITLLLICFVFLNRFVEGTQKSCNVLDYGAKGDGRTLDTNAIQHAIAKCDTVLLPAEYKFLSAPFNLTSNQIFVVNGILLATTDPSLWPVVAPLPSYPKPVENFGNMTLRYGAFIGIFNSKNITITGTGTIDGQGFIWWERSGRLPGHKDTLKHTRGRLIEPMYSSDIVIKGITILNAPFWTIHLYVCDNVLIEGVIIAAPIYSRNTDCIDPDSSTNVYIRNCTLSGGDDQIAIKSGQDKAGRLFGKPSINITVDNIRVPHGDGISIGSEMSGGIYNVVVKNIKFNDVLHPLRIKTGYGRGGTVSNVLFENVELAMLGQVSGTAITLDEYDGNILPNASHAKDGWPNVKNVIFRNIHGGALTAGIFNCIPELPCTNITMENVSITSLPGHGFVTCNNTIHSTAINVKPKSCF